MRPSQRQLTESANFSEPRAAEVGRQLIQFPQQRWDLPTVEDRITIRVQRAEHGKRHLVKAAERGFPRQPARRSRDNLALQFAIHPHRDHRAMLSGAVQ